MNSFIRITSGDYKGRALSTPGGKTHPMGERERLALFNMVSSYIPGSTVLDAFSGSGALGIEALSRGAVKATLIEKNGEAYRTILKNLETLGIEKTKCTVLKDDVYEFCRATNSKWEVILADPPYDEFDVNRIQVLTQVVAPQGILVLSHPEEPPEMPGLTLIKSHKYAGATLSIYSA